MPAVWKRLSVEQRYKVASFCKEFEEAEVEWTIDRVGKMMELGFVQYDDIHKLRGCYLASKEDPSVFVDPTPLSEDDIAKLKKTKQLKLDIDYSGFSFAPKDLLQPFKEGKNKYPMEDGQGWPDGRSREIAANLFRHMTNFVAQNHGWNERGDLVPSSYLDVHVSEDQRDLLNPTPRDIQMAAIIDQCSGRKATKVIAKRRIEFIEGNVNSYAKILNGPEQLKRIKAFNQLSASIATHQREKQADKEAAKERKKQKEAQAALDLAEQKRKEKEEHDRLAPGCRADVEKGIDHVLNNKIILVARRREILKIHFGVTHGEFTVNGKKVKKALYKMNLADTEELLRMHMGLGAPVDTDGADNEDVVDTIGAIPLPALPGTDAASTEQSVDTGENGEHC